MRPASASMISLLAGDAFIVADLYTITLKNGSAIRYTDFDIDLSYGGNAYASAPIARGMFRLTLGMQTDTMDITLGLNGSTTVNGLGWPLFAAQGGLDGARVAVERCFMASPGDTSAGTIPIFSGFVTQVYPTRNGLTFTVGCDLDLLNVDVPRNVYGPGCINTLYDTACGVSRAAFQVSGSALAGSTSQLIKTSLAQAAGYFNLGSITWTSGANSGLVFTVRTFAEAAAGDIKLIAPLPSAPAAGDTFTILPGCDRLQATCSGKFANLARFRGFPYIPTPESAV